MNLPPEADAVFQGIDRNAFAKVLQGTDENLPPYVESSIPRLHRIIGTALALKDRFKGPTLDVASGYGILYRPIKEYLPDMLPYSVAELKPQQVLIDGDEIPCHSFHCDKDRLPLPDNSVGTILFCDVLEHLIVDPVWTLLEFNRVLRMGGHLIITTPNAAGASRIFSALSGDNPGREIEYKPTSLYQRHNREWTVSDIRYVLTCTGFDKFSFSTQHHLLDRNEKHLLQIRRDVGLTWELPGEDYFGPEIFFVGEKRLHLTLDDDLPDNIRWPDGLYGSYKGYKKRPEVFPIVIGDDYS